jgi:hypothetical protein
VNSNLTPPFVLKALLNGYIYISAIQNKDKNEKAKDKTKEKGIKGKELSRKENDRTNSLSLGLFLVKSGYI